MRIVLPELLREGYNILVSLESLKGMCDDCSASLEITLVSWNKDLFIKPVSVDDWLDETSLSDPARSTIVMENDLQLKFASHSSKNYDTLKYTILNRVWEREERSWCSPCPYCLSFSPLSRSLMAYSKELIGYLEAPTTSHPHLESSAIFNCLSAPFLSSKSRSFSL